MSTRHRAQGPQPSLTSIVRCSASWAAAALLMLTAMPALAVNNYTFPGNLPGDCRDNSNGNYSCGALTLGAGDTIVVVAPRPATITVIGTLTIGDGAQINLTGSASELKFIVSAGFGLGVDTVMNANIESVAAGLIGARSKISGDISTGAGILTANDSVSINGNINTAAGAVNLGAGNQVSGNINTLAGVVTIGANSSTGGYITTAGGEVNLGARNSVGSNITTAAGVVTLGEYNKIGGSIKTAGGGVNIGANTTVASDIMTMAGVVNLGAFGVVGGNIGTDAGAVNVDNDSRICGNIDTLVGGVITLTANVKVGGGIHTFGAGAITISAGSTVGGNMKAMVGVITMTGVQVGGDVEALIGVITLTNTRIRGKVNTLTFFLLGFGITSTNSQIYDKSLVIPAACAANPATPASAASFDALESNTNLPWSKTARKPLYTKLTGAPFTLDIAALTADGMLESAYVASGSTDKYVQLELFDDLGLGAACKDYKSPVAVGKAKFASASPSGAAGRALSAPITVSEVHRSLLVRIRECADSTDNKLGTCTSFTGTAPACSSDRLAVRPPVLKLSTSTPMGVAPQVDDGNTIRAGTDFTLRATTTGGYDGMLTLDASRLTAQLPSEGTNTQSGGIIGVLTPSTLWANANAVPATYSEVGYLYIGIGAYRDDNYTAIDSTAGDCIISTFNNANLADTLSADGKYGCSIGNNVIASLGRFVPHHFSTVIVDRTPLICPPGLSQEGQPCSAAYSGQPFSVTITALSANNTTTLNYKNLLARAVTLEAWSEPGMLAAENQNPLTMFPVPVPPAVVGHGALSSVAAGAFTDGVASAKPVYTFPVRYPAIAPATLAAPTIIYLRARENTGVAADNATSAKAVAALSIEAGITVISGRFKLDNNYGSELLAVPVTTRAQYWNGTRFINNTNDKTSDFSAANVMRSDCKLRVNGRTTTDPTCKNATTMQASPLTNTMKNGSAIFKLSTPGTGNTGSIDLSIDSSTSPWLPSTKARIGVGIYKAGPLIYIREMY